MKNLTLILFICATILTGYSNAKTELPNYSHTEILAKVPSVICGIQIDQKDRLSANILIDPQQWPADWASVVISAIDGMGVESPRRCSDAGHPTYEYVVMQVSGWNIKHVVYVTLKKGAATKTITAGSYQSTCQVAQFTAQIKARKSCIEQYGTSLCPRQTQEVMTNRPEIRGRDCYVEAFVEIFE